MKLDWPAAERWLVLLIALHSYLVGFMLLFFTAWSAAFGGWGEASPPFFARQAGAFHFVVATAYLIEYLRYRGVSILVTTKAFATVFLLGIALLDGEPWVVPLSGASDGLMGLVAWQVHRLASAADPARR